MKLVAITLIIKFFSLTCFCQRDHEITTTWVSRRCSKDIYGWDSGHTVCKNPTYMVEEQQCVKNQDIFNSNYFNMCIIIVIILIQHLFLSIECRLALNDSCHSLSNPAFHKTFLGEDSTTDIAIIDVNQHKNKSLNLSLCQIAGLEVYRGEENAIEINPSGFTLTNRRTIQVNKITK